MLGPGRSKRQAVAATGACSRRRVAGVVSGLVLLTSVGPGIADDHYGAPPPDINVHLDKLSRAYPDWIASVSSDYVVLKNGAKFAVSDHRTDKSFEDLIEHPDVDDMFYVAYPAGSEPKQPPKNFDPGRVPGHAAWHLAPREMAWQGKTISQICVQIKDPARNGNRSLHDLIEHIGTDTLVGWAWAPGFGRTPAPGTQMEAGALVKAWVDSGAACP